MPAPASPWSPLRRAARALALSGFLLTSSGSRAAAPDRDALRKQIDQLLSRPPLAGAHVSLEVVSLEDGSVVYARGSDEALNPASNTKIVTAASALLRLGPEFRFTTDVLAAEPMKKGGKVDTLVVRGRGDPSINTERLDGMARDLAHRGLRQVGDLVLDDTWFDARTWGPGWESESSDKAYAAGVSALSLNHNSVGIYVVPAEVKGGKARIELEPEAHGFFNVQGAVLTVKEGGRKRLVPHTVAEGEHTRVVVAGRVGVGDGPAILYRRVTEPTFYFGYALKQALQRAGVVVTGQVRRAVTPPTATLLASYDSPELAEIVRDMNKVSSNFIAEMLVKSLGAELRGAPGTWDKGLDVMQDALAELGLPRGTYQLRNGSGLNDTNRFSAHQLSTLLAALYKRFPISAEFVSSLGIAARDGTLRLRMEGTDAAGRLRAKTGTLEKVTALSGYVQALGGERFVFSILVNDWNGRAGPVVQSIDRFGGLLASLGGPEPAMREAALLASGAPQDAAPPELRARVATYAQLAQAADRKNVAFLRTALRTERDPLLRVAVADALYRTDPEGGGSALLEALPATPEVFVKLRTLGRELSLPALPVVPSLLDLAAEGNLEALSRLCALAPLARGADRDPALETTLSEGLADVADAAADELLAALRSTGAAQAQATLELTAQGLSRTGTAAAQVGLVQALEAAVAKGGADADQSRTWLAVLEQKAAPTPAAAPPPAEAVAVTATPSPPPAAAPADPAPHIVPAITGPLPTITTEAASVAAEPAVATPAVVKRGKRRKAAGAAVTASVVDGDPKPVGRKRKARPVPDAARQGGG